ncbi:MAG TPA: hypothetical protein GXZ30_00570 [Propionibacterium sp.]|jgi:hypothetical protein|nr:hypothetical protein [Propionibacterium sp.]
MAGALTDAVLEFWRYLRVLAVDTVRMFVRLFPELVALQLLGWLGYGVSLRVGASISYDHPWLALVVFSTGFVFVLAAIVLQLRLVGAELGIRELLPDDAPEDDRDEGIGRLLALTLLPFLGIYAAFGFVQDRAQELMVSSLVQTGILADKTLASQLAPQNAQEIGVVVGVVVGAYLIRRVLDLVHEATDLRILGLLSAFAEAFFMLSLLLSGGHLLSFIRHWFSTRVLAQWIDGWVDGLAAVLAVIKINLPAIITAVGGFLTEQAIPFLLEVIGQPMAWLAVAALIYGSHVLSLADLWRKGTRPSDAARELARIRATGPRKAGSSRQRRVWLEFQEIFLGDIDDKYVPTFQSLRLVLHAGVLFLSAFVVLHWAITRVGDLFSSLMTRMMGGHTVDFWYTWEVLIDLSRDLPFEPLRICLLAVALREALLFFRSRAEATNAQRYAGVATVDTGAVPSRMAES